MRITSYKEFKKYLDNLTYRPKLLLHACCAPCSSHCILLLQEYFDITIFYSNDNIYPEAEFLTRLDEVERFSKVISDSIDVLPDAYKEEDYNRAVEGLESLGEKSARCYQCYKERLTKTALKAKELGYDFFSTTLSISPYKVTRWINEIGYQLEDEIGVPFLYSDFKKEEGYKHSIELSMQYGLYRQDYCGCKYSIEERRIADDRAKEKDQN